MGPIAGTRSIQPPTVQDVGVTDPRDGPVARLPRVAELGIVAGLLLLLEIVVFRDFLSGAVIPQFDFLGVYNLEAYAWWHDGSFFDPPQWMPYLWGGYPAVSVIQNGSFYLPIGIASAFGPYSLHAAAILAALHVAFGAAGAYVFARRFGASWPAAAFALVGWFFATGFYTNATHVDIARGYAWLPWLMLVVSTRWPWHRWWAIPAAALVVAQSALGVYPGMLVAIAYCLVAWAVVQQVLARPRLRDFVIPLVIAGVAGLLTTLVRFLPALLVRGSTTFGTGDLSTFEPATLGAILLPYGLPWYGQVAPFISYFLPASVLAAIVFIRRFDRTFAMLATPVVVSVVLGMPFWPWHDLVRALPGLGLSRFTASDFKAVALFGATMAAALAIDQLLKAARPALGERVLRPLILRAAAVGLLIAAFAAVMVKYGYPVAGSLPQLVLLGVAAAALVLLSLSQHRRALRIVVAVALVGVTGVSGTFAAFSSPGEWRADRVAAESSAFGASVDQMLSERADPGEQRPARRQPPPPDEEQDDLNLYWGRGFYDGVPSVYGYVNLRGTESFDVVRAGVESSNPTAVGARVFWSQPGMVIQGNEDEPPAPGDSERCAYFADCGTALRTTPLSYDSPEELVYGVVASEEVIVSANEAWYAGWTATACDDEDRDRCVDLPTRRGDYGQIVFDLPEGAWTLTLRYALPQLTTAWVLFGAGVAIAVIASALRTATPWWQRRRARRPSAPAATRPE
jgi:hypothetical protein